jgi:disulfide oxidoreductase YuzD
MGIYIYIYWLGLIIKYINVTKNSTKKEEFITLAKILAGEFMYSILIISIDIFSMSNNSSIVHSNSNNSNNNSYKTNHNANTN